MASLLEEINILDNWDYYERKDEFCIDAKIVDWNSHSKHKEFIKEFLKISGKEEIVKFFRIDLEKFERLSHTNSVFFLGCLFYEKLDLKNKINFRSENRDEFHFIWFLTSLMHDFGYEIEKNKNNYSTITDNIQSLIDYFDMAENLLGQPIDRFSDNTRELINEISPYYTKRFNGDEKRLGKIDHGIAAGLILYDALVKNRIEKKDRYGIDDTNHNLYWGDDLDKFYATSAYCIAVHNIRSENKELKFSIDDNPFLFLFWLVDTLEPTKCFDCCNPQYVLENIIIEFHNDKKSFTLKNKQGSKLDFTKYTKVIEGLKKFLIIEVNTEIGNECKISYTRASYE